MRISVVQVKARPTMDEGWKAVDTVLNGRLSDLVVLPEMALCGYGQTSRKAVVEVAEPVGGSLFLEVSKRAKRWNSFVVMGFAEIDGEQLYNSAMVVDRSGECISVYRKSLLYEADAFYTPGHRGYEMFDTGVGTFTVGICMDLNDDGWLSWVAKHAPDVIAFPTNWVEDPESDIDEHAYWRFRLARGWPSEFEIEGALPDRAPVNAVLAAANSYGLEGVYRLSGRSGFVDRFQVYGSAPRTGDAVVTLATPGSAQ